MVAFRKTIIKVYTDFGFQTCFYDGRFGKNNCERLIEETDHDLLKNKLADRIGDNCKSFGLVLQRGIAIKKLQNYADYKSAGCGKNDPYALY